MNRIHLALLCVPLAALAACGDGTSGGQGTLALSAGGGAALQRGFPHVEGNVEYAFVDGWSLQFTKYVVVIGDVQLTDPDDGSLLGEWNGPAILDLRAGNGLEQQIAELTLPAQRADLGFSFLAATSAAENRTASAADAARMIEQGWSYLIEGNASKDGQSVAFSFGLPLQTRYHSCINGKDRTRGIVIESNKTTGGFVYAHALHLFWDTLASGGEQLRFDAFAAVAGADATVTLDELAAQDLTNLLDADGAPLRDPDGTRVLYDDGGLLPPDQLDLRAFFLRAARSGVHFNGVGLCTAAPLD